MISTFSDSLLFDTFFCFFIEPNGLAKFCGRLKLMSYQTAKKASRLNLKF